MSEPPDDEPPPHPSAQAHHSRRSRKRSPKRPERRASALARWGARLHRRQKIALVIAVVAIAALLGLLVHHFESGDAVARDTLVIAVGFAPAVFVAVLVVGTFLLARLVGYRRKRLWVTTSLLIAYLALQVAAWHRADSEARAQVQEFVGDPDNPAPVSPSTPAGLDVFVLGLYTLGILCTLSALVNLRRIVRWHTPSHAGKHGGGHSGEPGEDAGSEPTSDDGSEAPDVDFELADQLDVQPPELSSLDARVSDGGETPARPKDKTPRAEPIRRSRRGGPNFE